jgi:CRP/FNR family transcriptional regulator, cyclic AMP receptor protein
VPQADNLYCSTVATFLPTPFGLEGADVSSAKRMKQARKLDGISVLEGIAADRRVKLADECLWRSIDQGATVLAPDTASTDVFFLIAGRVRITIYSLAGREVAFRDLDRGASFGELSAIDGNGRSASVIALENSIVATLPAKQFWTLLLGEPVIATNVLRNLAALIRDLTARVVDTTTLTVPERVRTEVARRARAVGIVDNRSTINGFLTHAELANQIGATREAVSRELSRMTSDGLIVRKGRNLIVADVEALLESLS